MARLKKRYWIPSLILLIIIIASLSGWRYWLALKDEYNLSIDWQGINIGWDGLSFAELNIAQQSQLSVTASDVKISWSQLSAKNIDIYWQKADFTNTQAVTKIADDQLQQLDQSTFEPSLISTIIAWLPTNINIEHLILHQQDSELFNLKVAVVKNQNTLQLNLASNSQDMATLAADISFNQSNSSVEIENGVLTTSLSYFGIEKGSLTLPFSGVLTDKLFTLKSTDKALVNIEKANFSDDLIIKPLIGKLTLDAALPIPFKVNQVNVKSSLTINKFDGIYKASEFKSALGDINLLFNKIGRAHV